MEMINFIGEVTLAFIKMFLGKARFQKL